MLSAKRSGMKKIADVIPRRGGRIGAAIVAAITIPLVAINCHRHNHDHAVHDQVHHHGGSHLHDREVGVIHHGHVHNEGHGHETSSFPANASESKYPHLENNHAHVPNSGHHEGSADSPHKPDKHEASPNRGNAGPHNADDTIRHRKTHEHHDAASQGSPVSTNRPIGRPCCEATVSNAAPMGPRGGESSLRSIMFMVAGFPRFWSSSGPARSSGRLGGYRVSSSRGQSTAITRIRRKTDVEAVIDSARDGMKSNRCPGPSHRRAIVSLRPWWIHTSGCCVVVDKHNA